mmetsp:Transcript_97399/g.253971  ORF Transcript_97399/g.253971 Transcript_97399/m.253971 type:complete len:215 (+) Transcript_97399:425-1069(+)
MNPSKPRETASHAQMPQAHPVKATPERSFAKSNSKEHYQQRSGLRHRTKSSGPAPTHPSRSDHLVQPLSARVGRPLVVEVLVVAGVVADLPHLREGSSSGLQAPRRTVANRHPVAIQIAATAAREHIAKVAMMMYRCIVACSQHCRRNRKSNSAHQDHFDPVRDGPKAEEVGDIPRSGAEFDEGSDHRVEHVSVAQPATVEGGLQIVEARPPGG